MGIPFTAGLDIYPTFIEICERRNLFTHTNGVVSSQYLAVCRQHGADLGATKLGDQLRANPKYFRSSINTIFELGIRLTQIVWRKLLPDRSEDAANNLVGVSYNLITQRRYGLAAKLLDFGLNVMKKHGSDEKRKIMVVNLANSKKLLGASDEAIKILDQEDWTAVNERFRICVAAVRDDTDAVVSLIRPVANAELLSKQQFREWPVFETIRKQPKFLEEFEAVFGEPYLAIREEESSAAPTGSEPAPSIQVES